MPDSRSISKRLLTIRQVMAKVGVSRNTIYCLIRKNQFPAQIKITPYASRWLESEIDLYIEDKARDREGRHG